MLVGTVAAVVTLHYTVAPKELWGLSTSLAFLPTVYGALSFGLNGGLGAALASGVSLMPHLLMHHRGPELVTEFGQTVIIVVSGAVIGWQVDRVRQQSGREWRAKQRLEHYARGIIAAQEEERRRVARELHDDTVQGLVSLGQRIEALERTLPPAQAGELRELGARSQALLDSVRRFSRDLRPSVVDDLGLVPAIEALANRQRTPTTVTVVGAPRRLSADVELSLFRIIQEALSNAEKHSAATRVAVRITFEDHRIGLAVADDGRGFSVPVHVGDLASDGKLGLLGMQERAELIGGSFHATSQPDSGTTITVDVEC